LGDITENDVVFGVVHLTDIIWNYNDDSIAYANMELFLAPFEWTNAKAKEKGYTDHQVMMQEMGLWERFENLKVLALNKAEEKWDKFNVKDQRELFYGFTRENNIWYSKSSTLNIFIEEGKDLAEVRKSAGKRDSGQYNADLMPLNLWKKIEPRLRDLNPYDGLSWSLGWFKTPDLWNSAEKKDSNFEKGQRARISKLVNHAGKVSQVQELKLTGKKIGAAGTSAVEALVTVLKEKN